MTLFKWCAAANRKVLKKKKKSLSCHGNLSCKLRAQLFHFIFPILG